ncbi:hypothetical protein ACHAQJ_003518 [Trichoderma viride]
MKSFVPFTIAAFAGMANAWWGQLSDEPPIGTVGGPDIQYIFLRDYDTGSTYQGNIVTGWSACTTSECSIRFDETSPGGYDFTANIWRTSDGCHHIDFKGAFNAGQGYCCGSLPCDIGA